MAEEPCRVSFRDGLLALRKAEEAATRRFEAADWLKSMVGPLGLPRKPTEQELIACLRSGIVLCNAINKVQPGAILKVVANQSVGNACDIQPLPAYQYFENVRNFLVAVKELQLPSFEVSDLEREPIDLASACKVVDCILALKSFHEFRRQNGGNGSGKNIKSPLVLQSVNRLPLQAISSIPSVCSRRLDMQNAAEKEQPTSKSNQEFQDATDSLARMLSDSMLNSKENVDQSLIDLWAEGKADPVKLFWRIMSSCLGEKQLEPILEVLPVNGNAINKNSTINIDKCCNLCFRKGACSKWCLLEAQEKELKELRDLLARTRVDFTTLQAQQQNDFAQLVNQIQSLSAAASGYQHAVKENRHLYNMLQELRGNIRVFCRIRPVFDSEAKSSIDYIGNDGSLMIFDPLKPQNSRKTFQFNKVFGPTSTQDQVYKDIQALIRSVMDGYNVCIFAYGQTGSGKTYTMCGPSSGSSKEFGINYLALDDLFKISSTRKDVKYEIQVQMVEIYNEQVRDLLAEDALSIKLEIKNYSGNGGLNLPDANICHVQSTSDILNLMKMGENNRSCSSTAMNHGSSRSHSILTVHVHGKDVSGATINSCLHLVDLAGSERVDKSEVTGDRMKEAQHINKSLSCLADVITALGQKSPHIPYRNSKLTQLLQNSLGGNAKMLMFAHVSPEADSFGETISTLKFAQRASTVALGAANVNKESTEIRELKDQIDNLKKALILKEGEKSVHPLRMKENTPAMERLKPMDRTPPRPRRLSIENGSILKTRTTANIDDRTALKSPLSKQKRATDYTPIPKRRISSEESSEKTKKETTIYSSYLHASIHTQEPTEETISCAEMVLLDKSVAKENLDETFLQSPCIYSQSRLPNMDSSSRMNLQQSPCNLYSQSRLPNMDSSSRMNLQQSPCNLYSQSRLPNMKSPGRSRHVEEEITPDKTNSVARSYPVSSNKKANTKGSQIRKSIQNIGRLIHGSDKRSIQCPSETPSSKFVKSTNVDAKSPIRDDTRLRRRQSLTTVEALGVNVSRRSSLGGKSTDSYSSSNQTARTPPPVHSSTKVAKRWL